MDCADFPDAIDTVLDHLEVVEARVAELEAERDKAQANYQFMVNRAVEGKDGGKPLSAYREQGEKLAAMERERGAALARVAELEAAIAKALPSFNRLSFEEQFQEVDRHGYIARLFAMLPDERREGV